MTDLNHLKKLKQIQDTLQIPFIILLAIGVLVTASHLGMKYRALSLAEKYQAKGFGALAADTLEPYRHSLSSSERGCRTMMNAYFLAQKADLLELSAQACISSGVEILETYLGYASSFELRGKDQDALRILEAAAEKFQQSPDSFYRIAQILHRNKKDEEAAQVFMKAASLANNNANILFDILQNLMALQSWNNAKALADRLKSVPTPDPGVKLLLARVMMHTNDSNSAKELVNQAKELMAKNPELKAQMEKVFADVLNTTPQNAGSERLLKLARMQAQNQGHKGTK